MKGINRYFFGCDEISTHDFCWFYGFFLFGAPAAVFVMSIYMQLGLDKY